MLNYLLAAGFDPNAISTGIITFFLGMLIVFLGIAVIVAVVYAVGKILKLKNDRTKSNKDELEGVITDDTVDAAATEEGISPRVVAVITAAISAYYSQSNISKCEFKVKKITRRS